MQRSRDFNLWFIMGVVCQIIYWPAAATLWSLILQAPFTPVWRAQFISDLHKSYKERMDCLIAVPS